MEPTVIGHPTQRQLVAFAESLVDRHAPVSALMASHVADCPACAREVKQIRASFEIAALARLPEPSNELTQRIVVQARRQRSQRPRNTDAVHSPFMKLAQIAAGVIATAALAYFSFANALSDITPDSAGALHATAAASRAHSEQAPPKNHSDSLDALAGAVSLHQDLPASPHVLGHRRLIELVNHDMSAALAALERNPGCIRANQVMVTSVELQIEGLRNLYLDRKL